MPPTVVCTRFARADLAEVFITHALQTLLRNVRKRDRPPIPRRLHVLQTQRVQPEDALGLLHALRQEMQGLPVYGAGRDSHRQTEAQPSAGEECCVDELTPEKKPRMLIPSLILIIPNLTHPNLSFCYLKTLTDRPYFLMSQRGSRILAISGYKFCVHYQNNNRTRWICSTHMNKGCKAVIFTEGGAFSRISNVHTHPPDNKLL
ncbi:hypothetical protein EVAR_17881_1 [Eumeta japonica]|uniref:FLYWCH-type domain-containing protein n=1 Tax=Eumeta variegata TaxID=151549 RepID=A0A4C1UY19_EUMVA|nr:hypothetical protein EVAR_17881_1 [Eumeta japonica]